MSGLESVGFGSEVKKVIREQAPLLADVMPATVHIMDWTKNNKELEVIKKGIKDGINNVDFENGDFDALEKEGFKHSGPGSYLISPIKEGNWSSERYFNCTGVWVIGTDAKTGKEISFLTHQDPAYFIDGGPDKTEKFSQELSASLKELEARSKKGTIEVLILGGNYNINAEGKKGDYQHRHYKESIKKLEKIVQNTLGFNPKVLAGPNNNVGSEMIVTVETQKRKVWIERNKQPAEFDASFQASEFDKKEREWLAVDSKK